MIELRRLSVGGETFQLRDLSLEIASGQYVVLMGRTGSGKTTILETICGLRRPIGGTIHLGGHDVTSHAPGDRGIGYVPQDLALFPNQTVEKNLSLPLRVRKRKRGDVSGRVDELATKLSLENLLSRKIGSLSGGEAQRVALARALSFRPSVLLLDEPTSSLDEETRHQIQTLLLELKSELKMTTLHVTHRVEEANLLGDRILELRSGAVVPQSGKADKLERH
ncbi:MAG: ABC transporter ATP-binding protein [Planctomycetota bacterium]